MKDVVSLLYTCKNEPAFQITNLKYAWFRSATIFPECWQNTFFTFSAITWHCDIRTFILTQKLKFHSLSICKLEQKLRVTFSTVNHVHYCCFMIINNNVFQGWPILNFQVKGAANGLNALAIKMQHTTFSMFSTFFCWSNQYFHDILLTKFLIIWWRQCW